MVLTFLITIYPFFFADRTWILGWSFSLVRFTSSSFMLCFSSSSSLLRFECFSSFLHFVLPIVVVFLSRSISLVFARFRRLLLLDLVPFYSNSVPSQFIVDTNERRSNICYTHDLILNNNEVDPTHILFFHLFSLSMLVLSFFVFSPLNKLFLTILTNGFIKALKLDRFVYLRDKLGLINL